jgi:signal transduction histidine kinase
MSDDDTKEALRRANAQLEEMHEKKKVLAALVVHDLRNPLSALQGNIELLSEELAEADAMVLDSLRDCRELAAKALSLVASLLDVEELEEGLLEADPTETSMLDFVKKASISHRATVEARSLDLSLEVEPDLRARLDVDLCGRMLENLLDNAVRYARREGRVVVRAHLEGGALVLQVGNDGQPVPESERDNMFERYYRIEARRAGARANRGLGLYFCRLVAEAHGGTIELTETAELPALFVVRLPQ